MKVPSNLPPSSGDDSPLLGSNPLKDIAATIHSWLSDFEPLVYEGSTPEDLKNIRKELGQIEEECKAFGAAIQKHDLFSKDVKKVQDIVSRLDQWTSKNANATYPSEIDRMGLINIYKDLDAIAVRYL